MVMKKAKFRCSLLVLWLISTLGFSGRSQDGHYWTQQYGTRSILLSNSVIGGAEDLGAVFYNPARLGLIESPAFLLSADVYEWNRFRIEDAVGEGTKVSKSDFGGVPSLVAGTFRLKFLEKHRFAYAVLQRQQIDADIDYKDEVVGDVIDVFPGEEHFGGYIRINQKVKEQWASLGWSFPISGKFSVGLTTSLAVLNQDKGNQVELQALSESGQVAIYRFNRAFNFDNYGLLWKAGLASTAGRAHWGLTVTTPVIQLSGKGNYRYEEFFSGIPGESENEDSYATSQQDGIGTKYRSPWAVGAGLTFPIRQSNLHLSSEWYSSIPQYTLLEAKDHLSQSSGDTLGFTLIDNLKSVVNFGIGTEIFLNEKISFYASFSTDFSAAPANITGFSENEPIATNTVFSADYYHYAGGVVFDFPGADITLGVAHTGGKQDFARPVDFPDENGGDILVDDEISTLKWERWRLVFSFSVPFFRDYADRILEKVSGE